ncbi:MAG: CAP domain-containing protein [Phycisphaerales bacterium]|nr:CAP domain-containing protein [Phycisphaerales bacterium]
MKRYPHNLIVALALSAYTALLGACNIAFPTVRIPTRPDNFDTQTDILSSDLLANARACVHLGAPRTNEHYQMLVLLNDYRAANGLNRLSYSKTLEQAADQYANRLFREGFFDHVAPDGTGPADRAIAAGFCDRYVGENLAYGLNQVTSAGQAMQGFKDSPHHNENMLREQWDYVGIGYLEVSGFQGTEYWWVQLFGTEQENN